MLFNSPLFIILFLPITLMVYWMLHAFNRTQAAVSWLILMSFCFYAWWDWRYVGLIAGGIMMNYGIVKKLLHTQQQPHRKALLILGVVFNLSLLGYFKYTDFFIENINQLLGLSWPILDIILPLGISFFIFQKIAFLVDAYRGEFDRIEFKQFTAFVIFFPQLIAGPIAKHNELFVQFEPKKKIELDWEMMTLGLICFGIGLFKKTTIADTLASYSTPFFTQTAIDYTPTFIDAWACTICYSFQIYFDFSGYSDMAVGLAMLFGYKLPINFYSPYQATNIVDFWRRWHMTLSRFLKDYLYIALGGNRLGLSRQKINLMLTMLIGGLWHGAAWTFVIWGMLHGLYLSINHLWAEAKMQLGLSGKGGWIGAWMGRLITACGVIVAWVFFRSSDLPTAIKIVATMLGFNGMSVNPGHIALLGPIADWLPLQPIQSQFFYGATHLAWIALGCWIVWFLPNTYEYLNLSKYSFNIYPTSAYTPELHHKWMKWKLSWLHLGIACCFIGAGTWNIIRGSEFLYFQF